MRSRRLGSGSLLLALSVTVTACGQGSQPVAIRTTDSICYASGITGDLVSDAAAGTAITGSFYGQRVTLAWPRGFTGRSAGSEVEVIDARGTVAYRTGTGVSLLGGFGQSGDFEVCVLQVVKP